MITAISRPRTLGSASNIAVWIAQILTAAILLGAGSGKVVGRADMVALFDAIGVGQWFRDVTGTLECTGALLLLAPWTAAFGAALLLCIMLGATIVHLTIPHTSPAGPVVLALMTAVLAWKRWRRSGVLASRPVVAA